MPNFDKTGPQGKGPKTGRGQGKCQEEQPQENSAQDQNQREFKRRQGQDEYPRRGQKAGRGFGRGRRQNQEE